MKKSKLIRISCLVISIAVLTGALAVAAYTGSPYETLKKAVFDAMAYSNVTIETEATLMLNGVLEENDYSVTINGDNSSMSRNDRLENGSYYYQTDELSISPGYIADDGTRWYNANIYSKDYGYSVRSYSSFLGTTLSKEDRNTAQFRFMELLLDTLVGDLKNNVTMSSDNGIRKISGTLTDSQLPALAKAGIDVLIEEQNSYGNDYSSSSDPLDVPMKSLTLDYVHGEAEVDADGNLLSINIDASVTVTNMFDVVTVIGVQYNVRFSDIGVSSAVCPIPGAESLLTREAINKRFGNQNGYTNYMNVYFTLNSDGSINEDSITTMWPGERDMPVESYYDYSELFGVENTEAVAFEIFDNYDNPDDIDQDTDEVETEE